LSQVVGEILQESLSFRNYERRKDYSVSRIKRSMKKSETASIKK